MTVIDCAHFSSREAALAYLSAALHLPARWGESPEDLYACLAGRRQGRAIAVLNAPLAEELLGEYGRKLLDAFGEAARINPLLSVYCF